MSERWLRIPIHSGHSLDAILALVAQDKLDSKTTTIVVDCGWDSLNNAPWVELWLEGQQIEVDSTE